MNGVVIDEMVTCPHCGYILGSKRNFTQLYMPNDMRCPACGEIVIHTNNPVC
jgi:DNA-directed RNA polymerase subunit RPC12/RpoP